MASDRVGASPTRSWQPRGSDAEGAILNRLAPLLFSLVLMLGAMAPIGPNAGSLEALAQAGPSSTRTLTPSTTPTPTPTPAFPDLTLTLTDAPDPVIFGAILTYTLVVNNIGAGASVATVVSDDLPAGVALQSLGQGCYLAGENTTLIICQVPPLAGSGRATFTIVATVAAPAGAAITNTAAVDAINVVGELNEMNNSASTTTIVSAGTPGTATPTPRATAVPPTDTPQPTATTVPLGLTSLPGGPATPLPAAPTGMPSPTATATSAPEAPLWLRIILDVPVYSPSNAPLWMATAGEWYKVARIEPGWALAFWEADPPTALVWIELTPSTQLVSLNRRLPRPPTETWLQVLGSTQTYGVDGSPRRIAVASDRYRVLSQEPGWAFAIWDGETPARPVWIELDPRVLMSTGTADRPAAAAPASL